MEIKRSSWHYKLNHMSRSENSNDNLCLYFWSLVGKLAFISFTISILGIFVFAFCTSPFIISNTILVLFILSLAIIPPLTIHYIRKMLGKPLEMPGENIVIEYMKAKKGKFCPFIKYV